MDEEAAGLMQSHRVYMVPTLSALATTAACRRGCGIPDSALDKAKAMTKRHQTSFRQAHRQGLLIAMGTDAGTPFNAHGDNAQELERMVAYGMSPMEAIITSTSAAARLIGIDDQVGTLATGQRSGPCADRWKPVTQDRVAPRPKPHHRRHEGGTICGGCPSASSLTSVAFVLPPLV